MYQFMYTGPVNGPFTKEENPELISLNFSCDDEDFEMWNKQLTDMYSKWGEVKSYHKQTREEKEQEVLKYKTQIEVLETSKADMAQQISELQEMIASVVETSMDDNTESEEE